MRSYGSNRTGRFTFIRGLIITRIALVVIALAMCCYVLLLQRKGVSSLFLGSSADPVSREEPRERDTERKELPYRNVRFQEKSLLPPIVVFQAKQNKSQHKSEPTNLACIIPKLCSLEEPVPRKLLYYVPNEYKPQAKMLRKCMPNGKRSPKFYSGEHPTHAKINTYDELVLGRSIVSRWYRHFPHFAKFIFDNILVSASLLLSSTFANAQCYHPLSNGSFPCHGSDRKLKPKIVVSNQTFNIPWNHGLLTMLKHATGDRLQFFVTDESKPKNESRMDCYRAGIIAPAAFDVASVSHEALLSSAGLERTSRCGRFPHVVVFLRRSNARRSIPDETLQELQDMLPKKIPATIEWVTHLGNQTFQEQIALAQLADVVASVHGVELSNMLFLKPDTRLVEIMPFALNSSYFDKMTLGLHVNRIVFPSDPDPHSFLSCVRALPDARRNKAFSSHYEKLTNEFYNSTNLKEREKIALTKLRSGWFAYCARHQRIQFNVTEFVRIVANEVLNVNSEGTCL